MAIRCRDRDGGTRRVDPRRRPTRSPPCRDRFPGRARSRASSRLPSSRPLPRGTRPPSGAQALDFLLRNVDVCRDLLHVVVILEHLEELQSLLGLPAAERHRALRHHRDLRGRDGDPRLVERRFHVLELLRRDGHLEDVAAVTDVVRAALERHVQHALLGGGALLDRDQPLLGEHPGDAAARAQVAVVLLEDVADLGDRPVTVVGQDRDHDRDPRGAVALVVDLLVVDALELARPLLDRALDVVARHARGLRRRDGGAQAGIGVDVTAPHTRGDGDLLDHLGEDLAALGVLGRLLVLDRAPLRVAGHEFPFPIRIVGRRALSRSAGTIAESRERRSRLDGYPVCYHSAAPQVNAAGAAGRLRRSTSRALVARAELALHTPPMGWMRGEREGGVVAKSAPTRTGGGRRAGTRASVVFVALVIIAGCGIHPAPPPEPGRPQTGVASWYGPGFHGHATTSGEIYDQEDLTAAHPNLPLGTRCRVTNLETGRSVDVRINDRGPFVKGRAIDLSYAAAREIGVFGPGTAPVRIEIVERPPGGYVAVRY